MKSSRHRYRLRGRNIEWGYSSTHEVTTAPDLETNLPLGRFFHIKAAIDRYFEAHVDDYLCRVTPESVRIWERTCPWARIRSPSKAKIYHARALAPWLEQENNASPEAKHIIDVDKSAENAETELRLINSTLKSPEIIEPQTWWGKLGALSLWEQSVWATQYRLDVFESALKTYHQSYLFVSSVTPSVREWIQIIDRITSSPRFSYLTLKQPHVSDQTLLKKDHRALGEAACQNKILEWLMQMTVPGVNALNLAENIITDEEPTPEVAALALTIAPHHSNAADWIKTLEVEPELAYFVRLILRETGQFEADLAHAGPLFNSVRTDPRWFFFWLRDFGENQEDDALLLLPNLDWVAELIHLKVIPALVAARIESEMDDASKENPLRLAFLAFATAQLNHHD